MNKKFKIGDRVYTTEDFRPKTENGGYFDPMGVEFFGEILEIITWTIERKNETKKSVCFIVKFPEKLPFTVIYPHSLNDECIIHCCAIEDGGIEHV